MRGANLLTGLVDHARRELELSGEDPGVAACLIATVAAFASHGRWDGGSGSAAAATLGRLLRYEALSLLTADPQEWTDRSAACRGEPTWQSLRDGRAISSDRGRTYTLLDDESGTVHQAQTPPPHWVRMAARAGLSCARAYRAAQTYLDRGPIDTADLDLMDALLPLPRQEWMARRWGRDAAILAGMLYARQRTATP